MAETPIPVDAESPDIEAFDLPEPVLSYISELEAAVVSLSKKADDSEVREELIESVLKSVDPAVAEIIKADRSRLAQVETELAAERAVAIRKSYIEKAAGFPNISDSPEALADILQEVTAFSPETAAKLESILGVAERRLSKSALFTELGRDSGIDTDAVEQATAIAKALVGEGKADSLEAARAMVWEANPALYQAYVDEQRGR